jgi:hypothetical protein
MMNEHRLELADVFRAHEAAFLDRWKTVLSRAQKRALRDIRDCRTAVLGGHVRKCDRCEHRVILYNSCRNWHCPKCQATACAKWLTERQAALLPVPYFHVVFTLPKQIGRLALQNQKQIYNILFRAASQSLLEIAADPKHLGASIGFLAVLHTWGQKLDLHPHLHCVAPGGGISLDGSRWIAGRKPSFFLPYRVVSERFRNLFLRYLKRAFRKGALRFSGQLQSLAGPRAFQALCDKAASIEWVVHLKPPFGGPERVLKYLAHYTHRVAISNHRLRFHGQRPRQLEWKDYADHCRPKILTLDAVEFIRRFMLHVLPSGLVRIRQFGFLANRNRKDKLELCRNLLAACQPTRSTSAAGASDSTLEDRHRCPSCQLGQLILIEQLRAEPRFWNTS